MSSFLGNILPPETRDFSAPPVDCPGCCHVSPRRRTPLALTFTFPTSCSLGLGGCVSKPLVWALAKRLKRSQRWAQDILSSGTGIFWTMGTDGAMYLQGIHRVARHYNVDLTKLHSAYVDGRCLRDPASLGVAALEAYIAARAPLTCSGAYLGNSWQRCPDYLALGREVQKLSRTANGSLQSDGAHA